jgi:hypothetical protein
MMHERIAPLALALIMAGCATTVRPQTQLAHPVAVYLADYGIHSSLLLPTDDGRFVEYAFGDYYYAALNHTWPNDALGALIISFQSALGRRYIEPAPGQIAPMPLHPSPVRMQVVYASQPAVDRLLHTLDERYRADGKRVIHNSENNMDYVLDREHYSVLNNCNHLTARCLREIGCDLQGLVMFSKFDVVPTAPPAELASHTASVKKGAMPTAKAE